MSTPPEDPTRPLPGAVPAGIAGARPRRLTRSGEDRLLAGVCSGLGRYFSIDPVVFRLLFAVLVFAGGAGVFVYLAAWVFVPGDGRASARRGPELGRALLIVALGVLAVLAAVSTFIGAALGAGPALAGVVVLAGLAMLIAGLAGRRNARWLAIPALVIAVPLALVAAADLDVEGGVGDREYRPGSVAELRDDYSIGMGELTLDLRDVTLPPGRTALGVEVGMGRALVLVPDGVCVDTDVEIGVGHASVLGRESGGMDLEVAWTSQAATSTRPRLVIDAEVGAGELEVRRGLFQAPGWAGEAGDRCGTAA